MRRQITKTYFSHEQLYKILKSFKMSSAICNKTKRRGNCVCFKSRYHMQNKFINEKSLELEEMKKYIFIFTLVINNLMQLEQFQSGLQSFGNFAISTRILKVPRGKGRKSFGQN